MLDEADLINVHVSNELVSCTRQPFKLRPALHVLRDEMLIGHAGQNLSGNLDAVIEPIRAILAILENLHD
jgi:hypothetical protein